MHRLPLFALCVAPGVCALCVCLLNHIWKLIFDWTLNSSSSERKLIINLSCEPTKMVSARTDRRTHTRELIVNWFWHGALHNFVAINSHFHLHISMSAVQCTHTLLRNIQSQIWTILKQFTWVCSESNNVYALRKIRNILVSLLWVNKRTYANENEQKKLEQPAPATMHRILFVSIAKRLKVILTDSPDLVRFSENKWDDGCFFRLAVATAVVADAIVTSKSRWFIGLGDFQHSRFKSKNVIWRLVLKVTQFSHARILTVLHSIWSAEVNWNLQMVYKPNV